LVLALAFHTAARLSDAISKLDAVAIEDTWVWADNTTITLLSYYYPIGFAACANATLGTCCIPGVSCLFAVESDPEGE
jgi:hypothetical protein